jgi:hypothetical protein
VGLQKEIHHEAENSKYIAEVIFFGECNLAFSTKGMASYDENVSLVVLDITPCGPGFI